MRLTCAVPDPAFSDCSRCKLSGCLTEEDSFCFGGVGLAKPHAMIEGFGETHPPGFTREDTSAASSGTRTRAHLIKSQVLYQLSYGRVEGLLSLVNIFIRHRSRNLSNARVYFHILFAKAFLIEADRLIIFNESDVLLVEIIFVIKYISLFHYLYPLSLLCIYYIIKFLTFQILKRLFSLICRYPVTV